MTIDRGLRALATWATVARIAIGVFVVPTVPPLTVPHGSSRTN